MLTNKTTIIRRWFAAFFIAAVLTAGPAAGVKADVIADFYRGKTVRIIIGAGPGGGYDIYGKLAARHLGKHVPGQPKVIGQNMPGGGGRKAAKYVYNVAPKDGSVLIAIAQTIPVNSALGAKGTKFDAARFNWIGRLTPNVPVGFAWHTAGIKSVLDAKKREVIIGGTGRASPTVIVPTLLNKFGGTRFKIVSGYKGTKVVALAMQQGEVEAMITGWASLKARRSNWLKEGKITLLFQAATERHPELGNIPAIPELGRTADEVAVLKFFAGSAAIGRSLAAPPGVPPTRIAALRKAFQAMVADPALRNDVTKRNLEFGPGTGKMLEALVAETMATPKRIIALARQATGVK